jgi:hypothetical protein
VANAKKIVIRTESHETFILRTSTKGRAFGRCGQCDREVELLSIDQAVSSSGLKTKELLRKIDEKEIHGLETESGHIFICSESLRDGRGQKGDGK